MTHGTDRFDTDRYGVAEVIEMHNTTDLARYRMADLAREATAARMARDASANERSVAQAKVRRVMATAVTLLLWPVRH